MGQSGQRAVPTWRGGQWLDSCGGALLLPHPQPRPPPPTPPASIPLPPAPPFLAFPASQWPLPLPAPPGCLPGPEDRHRHLAAPACHWPAVQPLSPCPVTAGTGLLSLRVAEGRCKEGWRCFSGTPLLSTLTTAPAEPGTLPWPCSGGGVQRPLPIEPCGVLNPQVPAAPGVAHRPCAHGGPRLRCSASRNGGPEQRRALHHRPGSLPGSRQQAPAFQGASASGAGAWALLASLRCLVCLYFCC